MMVLLLMLAACATAPAVEPARPPPPATTPTAGLYTTEQAQRGQRIYTTVCGVCHGRSDFTGSMFELTWMADPIGNLFQHISIAMPQNDPGSLAPQEYAAVVAYLLQLNGRPAGTTELPADAAALATLRW